MQHPAVYTKRLRAVHLGLSAASGNGKLKKRKFRFNASVVQSVI
jgi:hypothetical protein